MVRPDHPRAGCGRKSLPGPGSVSALSHSPPPCTAGRAALALPSRRPSGPPPAPRGAGASLTRAGRPEPPCAAPRGARPRARSHRPGRRGGPRAAAGPGREGLRAARAPPAAEGRACREAGISAVVLLEKLLPAEGGVTRAAPAGWGRGDRPAPHLSPAPLRSRGPGRPQPRGPAASPGLRLLRQPPRGSLPGRGTSSPRLPAGGCRPEASPAHRSRRWGEGRPRPARGPGPPAAARPGALPAVSRAGAPWGTTSPGPQRRQSWPKLTQCWPALPALLQAVPPHLAGVAVPAGCVPTGPSRGLVWARAASDAVCASSHQHTPQVVQAQHVNGAFTLGQWQAGASREASARPSVPRPPPARPGTGCGMARHVGRLAVPLAG